MMLLLLQHVRLHDPQHRWAHAEGAVYFFAIRREGPVLRAIGKKKEVALPGFWRRPAAPGASVEGEANQDVQMVGPAAPTAMESSPSLQVDASYRCDELGQKFGRDNGEFLTSIFCAMKDDVRDVE